jgi:hypothetical protein
MSGINTTIANYIAARNETDTDKRSRRFSRGFRVIDFGSQAASTCTTTGSGLVGKQAARPMHRCLRRQSLQMADLTR